MTIMASSLPRGDFKKNELVSSKILFRLYLLIRFALARKLAIGKFGGTVLMSLNILGDVKTIWI